ncbi:MAG: hypothetical protein OXL96_20395 [Candidatus Poribacteria bacterium]|nr:hypothetical protein [Candidatus Poribacteria bacterium]
MSRQHENTITTKLVDILNRMRSTWTLIEQARPFKNNQKCPDVFVTELGREPVAIEVKLDGRSPNTRGEAQAAQHLGEELLPAPNMVAETLTTAMALRIPARFLHVERRDLEKELRQAEDIHYVLLSRDESETNRFPDKGWAEGTIGDIAMALQLGATPNSRIQAAAALLEHRVNQAALLLEAAIATRPSIGTAIADILHQQPGEQTSRMAMLIITNAFVFQSSLAGKPEMKQVSSLAQLTVDGDTPIRYSDVLKDWNIIREVNYRHIFDVAHQLVHAIATDDELVGRILSTLCRAALQLVSGGIAQVHELAGIVFQRLIIDRKYIKANYTRPEAVALLSTLVLPNMGDTQPEVHRLKVADFACGTGALLNGVYQRILNMHEQAGGISEDIHSNMMEHNIGGCDIMPNASHLTASLLTSTYPEKKIGRTRIHTLPYGKQADDSYALGALDLLNAPEQIQIFYLMESEARQVGGEGDATVNRQDTFRHREFDIVVKNPPFSKPNADSGSSIPKPVFEGSERSQEDTAAMRRALRKEDIRVANGQAGLASYFVDLADRMLKSNGKSRMGFILPATALASPHWQKVRDLWATEYHDVIVITIADAQISNCTFSSDTGMAECMVVATKGRGSSTGRGTFISLLHQPRSALESVAIGNGILRIDNTRIMEDTPIGGDELKIGDETVGHLLDCPLPVGEAWAASRVKATELIQSVYRLAGGELWLPTQTTPIEIPICRVDGIATIGMSHLDVFGGNGRGAFDMGTGCTDSDDYPCLWKVKSPLQRAMLVQPDAHGILRSDGRPKLQQLLARNSRAHYNLGLRFNANSTVALFTERPALGVSLIKNVAFENPRYEIPWTLWCNTTLGLFCHWGHSSKQQPGRGMLSQLTLYTLPTLDVRCLSDEALANADQIFDEMKHQRMLPFNEADRDEVRHALDRRFLTEILGITSEDVHAAVGRLREKLCAEPSIHGGKKSRCDLEAEARKFG